MARPMDSANHSTLLIQRIIANSSVVVIPLANKRQRKEVWKVVATPDWRALSGACERWGRGCRSAASLGLALPPCP
jgi:hypothetical protein